MAATLGAGVVTFTQLEGWTPMEALYYSTVTGTTIGKLARHNHQRPIIVEPNLRRASCDPHQPQPALPEVRRRPYKPPTCTNRPPHRIWRLGPCHRRGEIGRGTVRARRGERGGWSPRACESLPLGPRRIRLGHHEGEERLALESNSDRWACVRGERREKERRGVSPSEPMIPGFRRFRRRLGCCLPPRALGNRVSAYWQYFAKKIAE